MVGARWDRRVHSGRRTYGAKTSIDLFCQILNVIYSEKISDKRKGGQSSVLFFVIPKKQGQTAWRRQQTWTDVIIRSGSK